MTDYVLAVGTHDPHGFRASTPSDAIRQAVTYIESRHAEDLRREPEVVVTMLGPDGPVTRPSERIDEFVRRAPGPHPSIDTDTLQPGDSNTPDCNDD